jgi:aspartyl-tRNA(Asn)/glutamyl-tRNA(Gln) amidotransferase subunit B
MIIKVVPMYLPVVGLEIHVQVKTNSKMFCRCSADYFGKEPNINICPVCFGLPGALPVPNKTAFEKCIKLALALNCTVNQSTKFDRKNYFYPDLAKGYQISQFDQPVGENGYVEVEVDGDSRRIRIQRVHIEEDTAKSMHAQGGDTFIDYNKSGIPLIEIVTFPDFESINEVTAFAKRLRQIVRYLNVSDAEMQKGNMRFELNISIKPDNLPQGELPKYKVEVKNIGSISVLEKVVNFEFKRQSELLSQGEEIHSQTRGLKGMTGETLFQRSKETSDDYRYFPEPDIPPIVITKDQLDRLTSEIPEMPHQRKQRYLALGLEDEQADIFVEDTERGEWFDELLNQYKLSQNALPSLEKEFAKWIVGEISGQLEKRGLFMVNIPLTHQDLIELVNLVRSNQISGSIAKEVINQIFEENGAKRAADIISQQGLIQISDTSEIENFAKQAIESNAKVVQDIEKNPNAIKFLVGQVMKLSKGKVNPKVAEETVRKLIK